MIAAFTEGVLRAMLLSKLTINALLLVFIGAIASGLGGVSHRALADDRPAVQSGQQRLVQADVRQAERQKKLAELEGTWTIAKMEIEGKSLLEKDEKWQLIIKEGRLTSKGKGDQKESIDLSKFLDSSKKPNTITYPYEGQLVFYGIYEVKGDELYVCGDGVDTAQEKNPEGRRPKQFHLRSQG
jgi:uncharacterized protein (TIGR03067 family)